MDSTDGSAERASVHVSMRRVLAADVGSRVARKRSALLSSPHSWNQAHIVNFVTLTLVR